MNFTEFESFLFSEDCFNNHDVSYIDTEGNQHYIECETYPSYQGEIARTYMSLDTIKIEQYEKVLGYDDRTVHIFFNKANGPSFGVHTDPVDVMIECLDGRKWLEIDGKEVVLSPDNNILIPAGTLHRALNYEKALMVSHGIGDTETSKRIHQDN